MKNELDLGTNLEQVTKWLPETKPIENRRTKTLGGIMSKKHFIALANEIRDHNRTSNNCPNVYTPFTEDQLKTLANFCANQNNRFNRERWFDYIAGECGPNGGSIKK